MKPKGRAAAEQAQRDDELDRRDIEHVETWFDPKQYTGEYSIEHMFAPVPIRVLCAVQAMLTGLELRVYNDLWLHARWHRKPHVSPDPKLYRDPRRMSVRRIARRVGASYPRVSEAIGVLRDAGLVSIGRGADLKHGTRGTYYTIAVPVPNYDDRDPPSRVREMKFDRERDMVAFAAAQLSKLHGRVPPADAERNRAEARAARYRSRHGTKKP